MNLIENEEMNQRNKRSKTLMITIAALIAFLLIICIVLLVMINNIQRSTLKFNLDNKSMTFASDLFVIENGKLYIAIKDFATIMGYEAYNGDYKTRYSEDTTNCYITSTNEIASFSLNSNTIYKKVPSNEDYEYFDIEEPVRLINDKLYILSDGMEIGTNCAIQYNSDNNQISVISLDYMVTNYAAQIENAAFTDNGNFNNKKAVRHGLLVVRNTDGHYGILNSSGQEIIGTKYTSISFKEDSNEFTVTTDEGKMGILLANGVTKIEPNYTQIKQISRDLDYYVVSNDNKYGVINQNGNTVIYLEYDQIGVDETRFASNGIENPYILFDNCIPVSQNGKWGIFDINGELILPIEYDGLGCIGGTQSNRVTNNVLIIPKHETIVVSQNGKYGLVSSTGQIYAQPLLNSVYSITSSGEEKYYMTLTMQTEVNGEIVDEEYTYDVDEYFAEIIGNETENDPNTETDTNTTNTTGTNELVSNTTENGIVNDANIVTENVVTGNVSNQV